MMGESMKGIYSIKNKVNNKVYIGKTLDSFNNRWNGHIYELNKKVHKNKHLNSAWNKYGEQNFEFCILEQVDDLETANIREKYWIQFYKSFNPVYGYNKTLGGDGGDTTIGLDNEQKLERNRKISANHSRHNKGKKMSEEVKEKIRKKQIGKTRSKEAIEKTSLKNKGKLRSDECREKLREQKIGKNNPMYGKEPTNKKNEIKQVNQEISKRTSGSRNGMYGKGEKVTGSKNGRATVNENQVLEIICLLKKGTHYKTIAQNMNISPGVVKSIEVGKTWKHITGGRIIKDN